MLFLHRCLLNTSFSHKVNADDEDLPFASYYTSAQSVAVTNTAPLYRPYDIINTSNNDEWPISLNYNHVFAANVAANVMGGYPESTFPWSHHAPETAYHNYHSYQHFPNWWNQYYYQQATYDVHYDPRQASVQADNVFDGTSASSFGSENAAPVHPLTTPYVQASFAQPTTFTTDPASFLHPSCQQASYTANANPPALEQQLPIRPVPQQAVAEPVHQCKACLRCCSSAGGLKRHAKFCRASQSNVEGIYASFKEYCPRVPEANQVLPFAQNFLTETNAREETEATLPINLSSSGLFS